MFTVSNPQDAQSTLLPGTLGQSNIIWNCPGNIPVIPQWTFEDYS